MIKVLIQVDGGSTERRIYNERTLEHKETQQVSRPYPYPYGFILGTRSEDGDSVDCYIITHESLRAGSIVECEPMGLLEQNEGDEIDHKVLAVLPDQQVDLNKDVLNKIQDFIYAIFANFPDVHITVGNLLPREDALRHIEELREHEN